LERSHLVDDDFFRSILRNAKVSDLSEVSRRMILERLVERGETGIVQAFLGLGIDINHESEDSLRPPTYLSLAVERKNPNMVRVLLQLGANPNQVSSTSNGHSRPYFRTTALGYALSAKNVDVGIVAALVEHGAEFPWPGKSRSEATYELLLSRDVDPALIETLGLQDMFGPGQIDLLKCLRQNSYAEAKALLRGMQISDGDDSTVSDLLLLASINTDHHAELLPLLAQAGANIQSAAALERAASGSHSALKILVQLGADVAKLGTEALVAACQEKRFATVAFLIQHGADINLPSKSGMTPLQAAYSIWRHLDEAGERQLLNRVSGSLVEYLLDQGADLETPGGRYLCCLNAQLNILQEACARWDFDLANKLIRHGANIDAPEFGPGGLRAVEAVCYGPEYDGSAGDYDLEDTTRANEFFESLQALGAGLPTTTGRRRRLLANLVRLNWRDSLQKVLRAFREEPALVDAIDDADDGGPLGIGPSPLQVAVRDADWALMELLVAAGEDVNSRPARVRGRTPLQAAATHPVEGAGLARWLLGRGADVDAPAAADQGLTALQGAAWAGNLKVAVMLLERGADVNAEAGLVRGRNAVEAAAEMGRLDMVQLLLGAGAAGNLGDANGPFARAVALAEKNNHFGVAHVLKAAEKVAWERVARF
jgi:ankyrin repeat protein